MTATPSVLATPSTPSTPATLATLGTPTVHLDFI